MALQKEIQSAYGVTANYHKVNVTNVDWLNKRLNYTICGYANEQARVDKKAFLFANSYAVEWDGNEITADTNIVAYCYADAKTKPEFENSIDV